MNAERMSNPVSAETKFGISKQAIDEIAEHGEPFTGIYVENRTYTLEFNGVAVEFYEAYSYWHGDAGPSSGIIIKYETPEGKTSQDWLGFVGHKEERVVQFDGEDKREATDDDLVIFESFLLHAKNVIRVEEATEERMRREAQTALRLAQEKERLGEAAHSIAKAALELEGAVRGFSYQMEKLMSHDGKLATQLAAMDDDELWGAVIYAVQGNSHMRLLPQSQEEVIQAVRSAIERAIQNETANE